MRRARIHEERDHAAADTRPDVLSLADDGHAGAAGDARVSSRSSTRGRTEAPTRSASSTSIPTRSGYGRLVGRTDMPHAGDELHHFGWNACSSCLCPYAPHPHMERRYLVVPGINSSRIHILDTKPDPRQPRIVKVIEPETLAQRTGYAAPHTVHCGPDGIFMSALGAPDGNGPGGTFILDPETFDVRGRWETRPRAAGARVRHLVAPGARHDGDQHVGHAQHGEGRREPRAPARREVRKHAARLGPAPPAPRAGAQARRRAADGARAASGTRPDARLRVRRRRDVVEGSVVVDLAVVPRHEPKKARTDRTVRGRSRR